MFILGVSCYYHDSAACIIKNGEIIAASQEERFSRVKHDAAFPISSIKYCLDEAEISAYELTNVVFYEKPLLKFERLLETHLAFAPRGFKSFHNSIPIWIKDKLFQKNKIINELLEHIDPNIDWRSLLLFSEHHLSHAASAYFPSPFDDAAIITLDGVGEWATTSIAIGSGNKLEVIKEINFPHSLGLLYSALTYFCGFKVNSGEYKIMGLAPYGEPIFADKIKDNLITIFDDGSFRLNMDFFDFATGDKMTNSLMEKLFDMPRREPEGEISQKIMDIASSIQKVTEEVVIKLASNTRKITGKRNLCLAGGVALNCVANGILQRQKIFQNIWVQPASGDCGGSIGAALAVYYLGYQKKRHVDKENNIDGMKGSYLGPEFSNSEIEKQLNESGAKFKKYSSKKIIELTCDALQKGQAIGWMQGRMEFGPRALGSRSIIADPRSPNMQKRLNLKIKFRESFRPFAPSVLHGQEKEWFNCEGDNSYMLFVSNINESKIDENSERPSNTSGLQQLYSVKSRIPAVTHVDYTARVQTVNGIWNKKFHSLLNEFFLKTGCPVLVNTSFNVRGEPIVCSPKDAFRCFMGCDLDVLCIGNYLLFKSDQNVKLLNIYAEEFEKD